MVTTRIRLGAVLLAAMLAAAGSAAAGTSGSATEVQFVQLDADSDGFITLGEWKGGRETFESLDHDGDAVLTRQEFFSPKQRYRTREERFRELDADHDGRVTAREWKWGSKTLSILDRNRDGFLNRQEFRCREAEGPSASASAARP